MAKLGELAQFVEHLSESVLNKKSESLPIQKVCDLLNNCNVWYQREWPESIDTQQYYLDFMVVGMSGTRYNIEVDGRQHYFSAEAIAENDARDALLKKLGYQVIRARAKDIMKSSSPVRSVLKRLV